MAESKTQIANMAIAHLGIGRRIGNLETERTQEAIACNLFYDHVLNRVLTDFDWSFARKIADLGLVANRPNIEWAYSYRYPSDCCNFKKILSGLRIDTRQSRISYEVGSDEDGKLIFTDQPNATAKYTILATDPTLYPEDFIDALSFLLAMYIAPQITSGDRAKLRTEMAQLYAVAIASAKASSLNEEQVDEDPLSEFVRIREGVSVFDTSQLFRRGEFE